jgi:hypothetical protein
MSKKAILLLSLLGLSASALHGCELGDGSFSGADLSSSQDQAIRPSIAATGEADDPTKTTGGDEGCEDSVEGCEIVRSGSRLLVFSLWVLESHGQRNVFILR